ncbi:MAG: prepilin-type N-terminal cleavage/methylation domain-containing protein [bacterium]|nr:prepilin-type N-terminal cleavage/methylation domain-containing protein [bacterium]
MNFKTSGFTLIELIIIIGIVGFLSAMVITGGNKGADQRKIILETRRLAEEIRKVQNMALSSIAQDCGVLGNKVVPSGIILSTALPDRYRLVADCDENKAYNAGSDILLSTVILSASQISLVSPASPLEIFFIPPLPVTAINTSELDLASATITLCGIKDITLCKYIYINSKGSVSVE